MSPAIQTSSPHTSARNDRVTPRWYVLPVVREVPTPPAQVGSAW
jgi:hypothetical protein